MGYEWPGIVAVEDSVCGVDGREGDFLTQPVGDISPPAERATEVAASQRDSRRSVGRIDAHEFGQVAVRGDDRSITRQQAGGAPVFTRQQCHPCLLRRLVQR